MSLYPSVRARTRPRHPADQPGAPTPVCRQGADPDLWAPLSENLAHPDVQAAIALCRRCPLVHACRQYATDHDEWGIWGATTTEQRLADRPRQPAEAPARPRQWRGDDIATCPSEAAYARHRRNGEHCTRCRDANAEAKRRRKAARRGVLVGTVQSSRAGVLR